MSFFDKLRFTPCVKGFEGGDLSQFLFSVEYFLAKKVIPSVSLRLSVNKRRLITAYYKAIESFAG